MNAHPLQPASRHGLDWTRALAFLARERQSFAERNPASAALAAQASEHLLFGVPLHWMNDWGTPFALHVCQANGAQVTDVDGHTLVDFCLGDTGAMFGHAPAPVAAALVKQAMRGYTTMLATADAAAVGALLAERFGLPFWQFAMSATDANRYIVRWIRAATGRKKLLVFNGCYHGTIEDVFVDLVNGQPVQRDSLLGQVYDLTEHTVVVEFNDLPALDAALQQGDVACVLAEPVMTNIGMVLPEPGFWGEAQALIKKHGALLVMDETHTISTGPGGYARAHGIEADALVLGKPVGGGVPCAVYGMSADLAARAVQAKQDAPPGHSGIGTTLTGNMLAMAAMRTTLAEVMTPAAYAHMLSLAERLASGLRGLIARHGLPWCVTQVGARTEFQFCTAPPRNGSEAEAVLDPELEHLIHLGLLNRGVMITPFHNMMLVCPQTTEEDVALLLGALDEVLSQITLTA
ncbi:aspartate aminotransferase family protein [Hydrogenophaga aromaticivorans]|uniref:aspartate aminotransferase family protein n=1 Tax=Hydrogenophaga aromaticivorans TaxID=2610898 RepID=UPI001B37D00D|nr:aspartate aminotransferase family protein [Hydrogenophaga aromaticivorans]MBQ0920684.1 aspartate aminotransferase family protein [Hydrogenophaga aromaticivorans]